MSERSSNPAVWAGFAAPDGHELAWKVVRPDGRTYNDFRWPLTPKRVACRKRDILPHDGACPEQRGDGLCLALSWRGAASGGVPAITGLAVAYRPEDVLGRNPDKLRVSECRVLGVLDLHRLLREGHGAGADLHWADLHWADLHRADLHGADLHGADFRGADLRWADLHRADLHGADLHGADFRGADLHRADLHGADLHGADFRGADLHRADLHGANLCGADFRGANLYGVLGLA